MISIIVPVYNAEKYLKRCVNSILNQTYPGFELLLVDDGSTDGSGIICDEYAEIDRRIVAFHSENRGVSAARNKGLENAEGHYICFIDADDYVGKDYLRILVESIETAEAGMALIGAVEVTSEETVFVSSPDQREVFNSSTAFREMIYGEKFGWASWGKLYRKELASLIRFPEKIIYDDFYTIPYILEKCGKCVYSTSKQYYYYQCEDSLTHSISEKSIRQWVKGMDKLFHYVQEVYPEYMDHADRTFIINVFRIIVDRLLYNSRYGKWSRKLKSRYHNHFCNALRIAGLPWKTRLGTLLFLMNIHLYRAVRTRWIQRHRNVRERLIITNGAK